MKYIRKGTEFINLEKCRGFYYNVSNEHSGKLRLYFTYEKGETFIEFDDVKRLRKAVESIEKFIGTGEVLYL